RRIFHQQIFTQNGGSLYEETNGMPDGALLEGGTPECRGPSQLLLYQRAHDTLLARALPEAQQRLADQGFPGTLGLLKNCRDADGQIYGAQENYEADLGSGAALAAYRVGTALMLPLALASLLLLVGVGLSVLVLTLGVMLAAVAVMLLFATVSAFIPPLRTLVDAKEDWGILDRTSRVMAKGFVALEVAVWSPAYVPWLWVVRKTTHRAFRRDGLAFLLTRQVFSGAGTLVTDPLDPSQSSTLHLSEKGVAMTGIARQWATPSARVVFDPGNLMKVIPGMGLGRFRPVARLFRRRQRMQLGLADANMAEWAEFLRLGTTLLVLDMAEAGALGGLPRLKRPVAAQWIINADSALTETVDTIAHGPMTALAIQRVYLERAEVFLAELGVASVEGRQVARMWRETLDALETDPDQLFGRVDWVTKRVLLERSAADAPWAVRKKVDLRYHELGTGYFAALEDAGLTTRLTTNDDIDHAITTPPRESPAWTRGRLVQRLARSGTNASVSWDSVRVRGPDAKVIYLADRRAKDAADVADD
ncbi:MAG: hypothetical protein ACI9MR_004779, partial [Myxococcota bacterium]